jgi:hypothetical protein
MKVFLSYATQDRAPVRKIATILRNAGLDVWDFATDILPGDNWAAKIQSALESSDAMVAFISPEALSSGIVSREIEYALGSKHFSGRLIPVTLKTTKEAPWILDKIQNLRYETPAKTGKRILNLLSAAR